MPDRAGNHSRWNTRIARARTLAATRPAAAEALTFYAAVAEYQQSLLSSHAALPPVQRAEEDVRGLVDTLNLEAIVAEIPGLLDWLPRLAPARLAESAADMRGLERDQWLHIVRGYLSDDGRDLEQADHALTFVVEVVLQPFAERAAIAQPERQQPEADAHSATRCPFCNALPVVGVLREEGQGARRMLLCSLCLTERPYLRVVCPSCGEHEFDALPVYTADQFDYIRVEACDRCRSYLKTIDLTKDGLAVPVVDDIASVSLDLWARERGYVRLRANLLGL